jgi:hypothetical protein
VIGFGDVAPNFYFKVVVGMMVVITAGCADDVDGRRIIGCSVLFFQCQRFFANVGVFDVLATGKGCRMLVACCLLLVRPALPLVLQKFVNWSIG